MSRLFTALCLPSGLTLRNRTVKAAMEENMATGDQLPGEHIYRLYDAWAKGGVGLILTGNVMVDPMAMTGPAGIALYEGVELSPFEKWAQIAKADGAKVVMQINHPGRQTYKNLSGKVLSPSNVPLDLGKHSNLFLQPKAMSEDDIQDVIHRFAATAALAQQSGFDGVQIHAAHGYLLSQFLSPLVNKREDKWGGSLENRARLLLEIVKQIKARASEKFSVSVKINSADFQRGGFDVDDAKRVVAMLAQHELDFIELSGGSYEAPAMQGRTADERTLAREAYFLEFAQDIAQGTHTPIMTTGGIKRMAVAERVLSSGVDLVGIASAMAFTPDLPNRWQQSTASDGFIPHVNWKNKTLGALATMATIRRQLQRLGKGKAPKPSVSPVFSLIKDQMRLAKLTKRYKKFMASKHY